MKFRVYFILFIVLIGCSQKTDKDEVKEFVKEISGLELPDDFKIIRNELHGDYQTDDSDFSRNVYIKFSGESLKIMINKLIRNETKGSWIQEGNHFIFEGSNQGYTHMSFDTISGDFFIERIE